MKVDNFKREFKTLNGVPINQVWVLFRRPLQLYNTETEETVDFKDLDEALVYEIEGKTLEQCICSWERIEFIRDGGRGSSSGMSTFKFSHAPRGRGSGSYQSDLPARLNVKTSITEKSIEATLKAFREAHVNDAFESGVAVDELGFVTRYVHGDATSVAIYGRKGEMVFHNHPSGGNFSDSDLLSTAMSAERGIVASGKTGDYTFVKTHKFNATAFAKAVKSARMQGKDYSDAADRWLKANQKKYGYTYSFNKA